MGVGFSFLTGYVARLRGHLQKPVPFKDRVCAVSLSAAAGLLWLLAVCGAIGRLCRRSVCESACRLLPIFSKKTSRKDLLTIVGARP